jgi:poly(3-hydroxybutyrate) depolymerase
MSTGGSSGSATAGMSGTSPAAGSGSGGSAGATPTTGCGVTDVPPGQKNSIMVDGTDVPREFIVGVPEGYDANHAYRLVFAFHGLTGTAEQIAGNGFSGGYYGLGSRIGDETILVAPQGLAPDDQPDQYGWPNTDGRDIAFIRAMVTWLGENYCIDQTRIFSAGFSYGGIISDTIGCEMSDVFRGIAPIAGAMFGRAVCDGPPLAVWMAHGTADDQVAFTDGEAARDKFIAKNHCDTSMDPVAVDPEGCVSYQGCDAGAPVVWCVHDGGHMVPSYAGQAISDFFSQF